MLLARDCPRHDRAAADRAHEVGHLDATPAKRWFNLINRSHDRDTRGAQCNEQFAYIAIEIRVDLFRQ